MIDINYRVELRLLAAVLFLVISTGLWLVRQFVS